MRKGVRIIGIILVTALILSTFAGCAGQTETTTAGTTTAAGTTTTSATAAGTTAGTTAAYPIVTQPLTLTWWVPLVYTNILKNQAEMYCWQQIMEKTGVTVEFVHPPFGGTSTRDAFNLMIASNALTDIITYTWQSYSGGPGKALASNVVIKLNDYLKDNAPNYMTLLDATPNAKRDAFLDDGTFYGFATIPTDKRSTSYSGFLIRNDWLTKVNQKVPTTMDQWYSVLTAFRDEDPNGNGKKDEIGLVDDSSNFATLRAFMAAWGIRDAYHKSLTTGKITYGPYESVYKDYLTTMNKWYAEGLIDSEFVTSVRKNVDEKVSTNLSGAFYGVVGSQLGTFNQNNKIATPGFELIAAPEPKAPDGKVYSNRPELGAGVGNQVTVITPKNKNVKESVRLIDYLYTDEARTFIAWGELNKTYVIENGKPKFTDYVMNNPDGLTKLDALAKYALPTFGYFTASFYDSVASINAGTQIQKDAMQLWYSQDWSLLMPLLYPTEEESSKLSRIQNNINTYRDEMFVKFIIGKEPLSNFDAYIKALKDMGMEDAIAINQTMYDRAVAKK